MTGFQRSPSANSGCVHVDPELVAGYARGTLGTAAAWSVEAHLPGCQDCRSVLTTELDQLRLDSNRSVLLARLALPQAGWVERTVTRWGVPQHVWRLVSVTPSLRRSWLAGVILVLGTAVGAARLAAATGVGAASTAGQLQHLAHGSPAGLLPFLILAPLLPLAGVAAAFHPKLDPAADLATAAPVSGIWLFCVRSVAVIASALVPTVLAALLLPGGGWLPMLVVVPALAVSVAALALATVTGPFPAAAGAGAGWIATATAVGLILGSPAVVYHGAAQAAWLAVILGASGLLVVRRHKLEFGWNR